MKKIFIIPFLFLAACASEEKEKPDAELVSAEEVKLETVCFIKTAGHDNVDTSAVRFNIDDYGVTGEMKHLPWQKDAQVGTLDGTKKGDIITAHWHCTQEGMDFMEPVSFMITDNKALQLEASYKEDGTMYIPENGEYTVEYLKIDCSNFPERNY